VSQAWLTNFVANKEKVWPHLVETYGDKAKAYYYRWQIFYMASSELFKHEGGDTFGVCHYLFQKPQEPQPLSS
jgi:cation-transporting ATPase 13A3/4/5